MIIIDEIIVKGDKEITYFTSTHHSTPPLIVRVYFQVSISLY